MGDTTIEWASKVWNCLRGCSLKSMGCMNCYAMILAWRFSGPGQPYEGLVRMGANGRPVWTGKLREVPSKLADPLAWRKPQRVFVNSMSDLFHEDVSVEFIEAVFGVMALAGHHTYQVLTKRADRMAEVVSGLTLDRCLAEVVTRTKGVAPKNLVKHFDGLTPWPLPNVHLGVSVENQETADERLPWLAKVPTVVPWVSYEPALGPVDFAPYLSWLGWVVIGGESGRDARRFELGWARDTIRQFRAAGKPAFLKQLGACASDPPNGVAGKSLKVHPDAAGLISLRLKDSHGGDEAEWPEDLQGCREFPSPTPSGDSR